MNVQPLKYIVLALLGCVWIGCQQTELEVMRLDFANLQATAGPGTVTLEAELMSDVTGISECGFFVGITEKDMIRHTTVFEDGCFSKTITGLDYETEYIYIAFVGNGRNVICSENQTFVTLEAPPVEIPDDGSGDGPGDPEPEPEPMPEPEPEPEPEPLPQPEPEPEPEPVYELSISSEGEMFDGGAASWTVVVSGNADFEVVVPEDVDWVTYQVSDRECRFSIDPNISGVTRTCEVVFRSLNHDFSCIYRISQSSRISCNHDTVELTHIALHSSFALYLLDAHIGGFSLWPDGCDWCRPNGEDGRYSIWEVDANLSMNSRECVVTVSTGTGECAVKVIQHSYLEYIEFKDPNTKSLCVALYDTNGDDEVSFDEAVSVRDMTKDSFAGKDFTSFDELQFFVNAFHWNSLPEYLFEGSDIESVMMPQGLYEYTPRGIFKNCRNLKNVDLGHRSVDAEVFMGCTSLKEIDALIHGEMAFMGCTGLEKVIQKSNWIPDMAFKGCCNLRTLTFESLYGVSPASIGKEAFHDCAALSEISILPLEIVEIGESAFNGCSSLEEIRLQRNVKNIGDRAFYGCSSLKAVYLMSGTPPSIGEAAFFGTSPDLKFYVPSLLLNVYRNKWPDLADRIEACDWME